MNLHIFSDPVSDLKINIFKNFYFMAHDYKIEPVKGMKILGFYLRNDLKLDSQIGKLSANLHNKIYQLRKLSKYTDFSTRNIFIKSYIMGKINYVIPLYMNASIININKLQKVIMNAARTSIGNYCFKKSKIYILQKCGFLNIRDLITYATICFFYKLERRQKPQSIIDLYAKPNDREKVRWYRPLYLPKSIYMQNSCLHRGAEFFL